VIASAPKPGQTHLKPGQTHLKPGQTRLKPGQTRLKPSQTSLKPGQRAHSAPAPGVTLEVVVQPPARAARIEAAEQLSMRQLLAEYARATGMRADVLAAADGVLQV
jgi:hypothetical protein